MPRLSVKADDILKRADGAFDARVKLAAKAKLERMERVSDFVVAAFATALDEHFARQDQAHASPYPDKNSRNLPAACIQVNVPAELQADVKTAFSREDETHVVHSRVMTALAEAGYQSEGIFSGDGSRLQMFIRDPEFKP